MNNIDIRIMIMNEYFEINPHVFCKLPTEKKLVFFVGNGQPNSSLSIKQPKRISLVIQLRDNEGDIVHRSQCHHSASLVMQTGYVLFSLC